MTGGYIGANVGQGVYHPSSSVGGVADLLGREGRTATGCRLLYKSARDPSGPKPGHRELRAREGKQLLPRPLVRSQRFLPSTTGKVRPGVEPAQRTESLLITACRLPNTKLESPADTSLGREGRTATGCRLLYKSARDPSGPKPGHRELQAREGEQLHPRPLVRSQRFLPSTAGKVRPGAEQTPQAASLLITTRGLPDTKLESPADTSRTPPFTRRRRRPTRQRGANRNRLSLAIQVRS
jgi:predicted RNA-binding protein YlqC (UPF0109 family)